MSASSIAASLPTSYLPPSYTPPAPPAPPALVLKVRCVSSGDCRRFPLPASPPLSFDSLLACVSSLFSLPAARMQLQWRDEEGDAVTVASDDEWQRLQADARHSHQRVLQLAAVECPAPTTAPQPAQQQQRPLQQLSTAQAASVQCYASQPSAAAEVSSVTIAPPAAAQSSRERQESSTGEEKSPSRDDSHSLHQPQQDAAQSQQPHFHHYHHQSRQQQQQSSHEPFVAAAFSVPSDGSDEDSPVLIEGSNLPTASDSRTASALWKRHKYKAQQAQIERRGSVPSGGTAPPTLTLHTARAKPAGTSQQLAAPSASVSSSSSLPSSPLSRSPSASSSSSPLHRRPAPPPNSLVAHLDRARLQLRSMLPSSQAHSALSSSFLGHRASSSVHVSLASEQERRDRVAAAYDLLASFIAGGDESDGSGLSRDEVLSRCIALFVYNERFVADQKRRNDELAAALGGPEVSRRAEEAAEEAAAEAKRRELLNEAQLHGKRSLAPSSADSISSSCSPALVTVMAIIHRHLRSRVVTDVPATLELFAAVLADTEQQVQRELARESALRQRQHSGAADCEERKDDVLAGVSYPSSSQQFDLPAADGLLASLALVPAPLRDTLCAVLTDCAQHAASVVGHNPSLAMSPIRSHAFAATLHAFRSDLAEAVRRQQPASLAGFELPSDEQGEDEAGEAEPSQHADHWSSNPPATALIDVSRGDVLLSDKRVLKAVAKALKKEERQQRKDDKRRRKASKGRSTLSAALQHSLDEHDSHYPPPGDAHGAGGSALPLDDEVSWQHYPTPQPVASPVSPIEPTSSPFAYQPFPYTLSHKQHSHQPASPAWPQPPAPLSATSAAPRPAAIVPSAHARSASGAALGPTDFPSLSTSVRLPPVPAPAAVSMPVAAPVAAHYPFASPSAACVPAAPPELPLHPPVVSGRVPQQASFASVVSSSPAAAPSPASSSPASSRRLASLLQSLSVMGFQDESLNTWLLARNNYDLNATVEWLIVQSEVGLSASLD